MIHLHQRKPSAVNNRIRNEVYEKNKLQFFSPSIAEECGVIASVIIHFMSNTLISARIEESKKGRAFFYDKIDLNDPSSKSTVWFAGSAEYIRNLFPYFTAKQISFGIESAVKAEFIIRRRMNSSITSPNANAEWQYTVNLSAVRGCAMLYVKKNPYYINGIKRSKKDNISFYPVDVRDHGLPTAIILRHYEVITEINEKSEMKYGLNDEDKIKISVKSLARDLPYSETRIRECVREYNFQSILDGKIQSLWNRLRNKDISLTDEQRLELADKYDSRSGSASNDPSLPADWKAHGLITSLRVTSQHGFVDNFMKVHTFKFKTSLSDNFAATVFFELNPLYTPIDMIVAMQTCCRLCNEALAPTDDSYDPLFHIRKANRLRYMLINWKSIHEFVSKITGHENALGDLPMSFVQPPIEKLYPSKK